MVDGVRAACGVGTVSGRSGGLRPWHLNSGWEPYGARAGRAGEVRAGEVRAVEVRAGEVRAEHGLRTDLFGDLLGASGDVVRQLHARWRRAGLAATGRLGPGPGWCWLTRAGLAACGLPYEASRPPLARLAHVHAVGVVRLAFERWEVWQQARASWRSERHLRWLLGAGVGKRGHV